MANDAILLIDERLEFLRGTEDEIRQLRADRKLLAEARKTEKAEGNGGGKIVPRHDLAAQIQAFGADSLLPPGTVISTTVQGGPPVSKAKVRARNAAVEKQRKPRQKGIKEAVVSALMARQEGMKIVDIADFIPAAAGSVRAALNALKDKGMAHVIAGGAWKLSKTANSEDYAAA